MSDFMEFLMTYGWAILVILVAIGALAYFGVLKMPDSTLAREHCPEGTTYQSYNYWEDEIRCNLPKEIRHRPSAESEVLVCDAGGKCANESVWGTWLK